MARAAIYDGGKEVPVSIFEVSVHPTSRVIGAPIETGEVAIDNKVIDPKKIVVTCTVVNDRDAGRKLSAIDAMFANREYKFYSICDGAKTHRRMVLQNQPYKRTAEKVDFYNFELTFIEAMIVQGTSKESANKENSDTRHGGPAYATQA